MRPGRENPVVLQVRGVSHHLPTQRGRLHVLQDVSLQVRQGEYFCLLGPSGCGKSTLLHIIAGLVPPDAGEVLVDGRTVAGPGPDRTAVFQEPGLFPWLTVRENVAFGLGLREMPPAERTERVREALEMVRLGRLGGARMHALSPGMRQRVAIARALAVRPRLLLMDEPFGALDAQSRNVMQEEMQRIWAQTGMTVFQVTHNAAEAVRLGDRVAVLSYRPATVKREVAIRRPRPRLADDPHVLEIRTFLLRTLKEDVRAAVEEELGDG